VTHLVAHPVDLDRYYAVRNPFDNSGSVQCVTLKVVPGMAVMRLRFCMCGIKKGELWSALSRLPSQHQLSSVRLAPRSVAELAARLGGELPRLFGWLLRLQRRLRVVLQHLVRPSF